LIRWYAHAVSHIGLDPERVSQRICDPLTLDTAWYRQFSGASELARGGKKFSIERFLLMP
jgi:hypothetical protein